RKDGGWWRAGGFTGGWGRRRGVRWIGAWIGWFGRGRVPGSRGVVVLLARNGRHRHSWGEGGGISSGPVLVWDGPCLCSFPCCVCLRPPPCPYWSACAIPEFPRHGATFESE